MNDRFFKVWSGVLSSFALVTTEGVADVQMYSAPLVSDAPHIEIRKSKADDLFLHQASGHYNDVMQFAGHRSHRSHSSHSSHRSHYSSSSYGSYTPVTTITDPTTTTTEPNLTTTSTTLPARNYHTAPTVTQSTSNQYGNALNITDRKMVQISLNLLGFDAGKVDGKMGSGTKSAIRNFQISQGINSSGALDGQTCLFLARNIRDKYPNDSRASKLHRYLLKLYLKIETK